LLWHLARSRKKIIPLKERHVLMRRILPFFFLAMMVSWGCHRKSPVPAQTPTLPPATAAVAPTQVPSDESPPPAVTPSPEETETETATPESPQEVTEKPEPGTTNLESGEINFKKGNYRQAAREFKAFLDNNPKSNDRDRALFYRGLSHTLASDSSHDPRQAEKDFRELISKFPGSLYTNQAAFILSLLAQVDKLRSDVKERDERIKKLSEELQVLKEIDLQRRPSRPKE
jgi:TolA-binding protein